MASLEEQIQMLVSAVNDLQGRIAALETDKTKDIDFPGEVCFHEEPAFTGIAYVSGVKVTSLLSDKTKLWIKCDLINATATQETGPPAIPFPDGEEWYYKPTTYGDIHESRM